MIYNINGRALVDNKFKEYEGKPYEVESYEEAREIAFKMLTDIIKNDICATALVISEEEKGIMAVTDANSSLVVARTFFFPLEEEEDDEMSFLDQIDHVMEHVSYLDRHNKVTSDFYEYVENICNFAYDRYLDEVNGAES